MTHHSIDYASIIRANGYRLTPQRELVLDALCGIGGHATADAIAEYVQTRSAAVDRSTVYRSLDFLAEIGLITVAEVNGTRVYELAVGQPAHHHLRCQDCGTLVDLDHTLFDSVFADIQSATGFEVKAEHLILSGLCAACKQDAN